MKSKKTAINAFLILKIAFLYFLFLNAVKFMVFRVGDAELRYAETQLQTNRDNISPQNLILELHDIFYRLTLINVGTSFLILLLILIGIKVSNQAKIYYFLAPVLIILLFIIFPAFEIPKFMGIIPATFFSDFKNYLFINGLIYSCLAIVLYWFTFFREPMSPRLWHTKRNDRSREDGRLRE